MSIPVTSSTPTRNRRRRGVAGGRASATPTPERAGPRPGAPGSSKPSAVKALQLDGWRGSGGHDANATVRDDDDDDDDAVLQDTAHISTASWGTHNVSATTGHTPMVHEATSPTHPHPHRHPPRPQRHVVAASPARQPRRTDAPFISLQPGSATAVAISAAAAAATAAATAAPLRPPPQPAAAQFVTALPRINTARLKAAIYPVGSIRLEIRTDGAVVIEFPRAPSSTTAEVLDIPAHGSTVSLSSFDLTTQPGSTPNRGPAPPPAVVSFAVGEHMPARLLAIYRFVTDVVAVLRAKTPKVIAYAGRAKFALMEDCDGPTPSFDAKFETGFRVRVGRKTIVLNDPDGRPKAEIDRGYLEHGDVIAAGGAVGPDTAAVTVGEAEMLVQMRSMYCYCCEVEKMHIGMSGTARGAFPVVVGRRQPQQRIGLGIHQRRPAAVKTSPSVASPTPHAAERGLFVMRQAFISGVGWGFLLASGETWVLRLDGVQLFLDPAAEVLLQVGTDNAIAKHSLAAAMTSEVAALLAQVQTAVEMIRAQGTHSNHP